MKKTLIFFVAVLSLAGCNFGTHHGSMSPSEAVTAMFQQFEKGEVAEAKKFMSIKMQDDGFATRMASGISAEGLKTLKVDELSAKGEIGTVDMHLETNKGHKLHIIFRLQKENGDWLVADRSDQTYADAQREANAKSWAMIDAMSGKSN